MVSRCKGGFYFSFFRLHFKSIIRGFYSGLTTYIESIVIDTKTMDWHWTVGRTGRDGMRGLNAASLHNLHYCLLYVC